MKRAPPLCSDRAPPVPQDRAPPAANKHAPPLLARFIHTATLLLFLLCVIAPHLAHAAAGNAPVGGGGSCTYGLAADGTVGQQQPYDNGLYTCLSSGGTWTPEALILGDTMANGSAASCSSTTAGMLIWTGAAVEFCNGTSFTSFASLNPGSGTLGATSGILVELAAGTAAAPSLTFYADTQTGLYQPAIGTIAITTQGTESGVFDGSGNFNLVGATAAYEIDSNKILTVPAADTVYSLAVGNGALANDSHTGGGTNGEYNTAVGYDALNANTTGANNTAFGDYALQYATTASQNTAVGDYALRGVAATPLTGSNNTAVGYEALMSAYGTMNSMTAIGALALETPAATTVDDTAVGYAALETESSAGSNTAVGYEAMMTTGSVDNVGIGYQALFHTTGGSGNNVAIGYQAMHAATTGAYNVAIGTSAMKVATGSDSVAVGYQALLLWTGTGPMTVVGFEAMDAATTATNDDAFGLGAGEDITTGSWDMAIGDNTFWGTAATPMTGSGYNTAVGESALGYLAGTAANNTAVGFEALQVATIANNNTAIGAGAGNRLTTGGSNTAVGANALSYLTTGSYNTAGGGYYCLSGLEGAASRNTGLGQQAGQQASTTSSDNTLIGFLAGYNVTGNSNIVLGESTQITSGSSNIIIGNNSLAHITATSSNQIDIGDLITGLSGSGTTPNVSFYAATADASYSQQTPLTGFSITIGKGVGTLLLTPAGTLATGTIKMPANPTNGQFEQIVSTKTITTLTLSANTGQTINNAVTTIGATTPVIYEYLTGETAWYRIQ